MKRSSPAVGTELARLIKWFTHVSDSECPTCKTYASLMNDRGVEWCEENVDIIAEWMRQGAEKKRIVGFSLESVPGFSIGAKALVLRAIVNAKAKAKISD